MASLPLRLPIRLEREPLVDAVFELRFAGVDYLSDILPGFLFHEFGGQATISRLPAAEIPKPMRSVDPNLRFAPTQKLDLERFVISIGDQNVLVNCKLPYPKWKYFKEAILDVTGRIKRLGIAGPVERYSLKYVNIIETSSQDVKAAGIRVDIKLGDVQVGEDHFSLQVRRNEDDIVHVLSVLTNAQVALSDGKLLSGTVIDVDSIRQLSSPQFNEFVDSLEFGIESLRQANKAKFFGCLTEQAINAMGPVYE